MNIVHTISKRCYFCGGKPTSVEHLPPKQMFKGFSCDSITVPSCNLHNNAKSHNDQTIIHSFMAALDEQINNRGIQNKKYHFHPDVIKSIQIASTSFNRTKRSVMRKPLITNPSKNVQDLPDIAFLPHGIIEEWICKLTAGLICDGMKGFDTSMPWLNAQIWSPGTFKLNSRYSRNYKRIHKIIINNLVYQEQFEKLPWIMGWSAHPRSYPDAIYNFKLHFDLIEGSVIFRHRFYDQYTWYAKISLSVESMKLLLSKVFN